MQNTDQHQEKPYRWLACIVFLAVVVTGFFTVSDYGMSWDEPFRFAGGDKNVEYYESLLRGEPLPEFDNLYPGLFDLPLALFRRAFPNFGSASEQGHVFSFLFGCLALALAWHLCCLLGGARAGFWALVFLVATPRFYGHMFFNPKDVPFAAAYLLALYFLVRVLLQLPDVARWRSVVALGVACGLALSARIGGVLLLFYFAFFVFCFLVYKHFVASSKPLPIDWKRVVDDCLFWAARGGLAGMIALGVLLLFWPAGHADPLFSLYSALTETQAFKWNGLVLMDGHFWRAQDLPAYYVLYWLKVSLPEWMMLLLLLSLGVGGLFCFQALRGRRKPDCHFWACACLGFGGFFPLAYMLYRKPVLYDGMRHFLFVLPVFACVAALVLEWILRQLQRRGLSLPILVGQGAIGLLLLLTFVQMWRLHPYQYVYFNTTSGGLNGAFNRDETDYWGISHKEAAEWLNAYAAANPPPDGRPYRVHVGYTPWMLGASLDRAFVITHDLEAAEFSVAITRLNLHQKPMQRGKLVHVVERLGVPLCMVYEMPEPDAADQQPISQDAPKQEEELQSSG